MPLPETCGPLKLIPEKKGVQTGCGPSLARWTSGNQVDGEHEIHCDAKTWPCLCFYIPKVIQRGPRHGQEKYFIKCLVRDYWVIIQFQATQKVSATGITFQVGSGSERNPLRMLVRGSLALNSLSFLAQGS